MDIEGTEAQRRAARAHQVQVDNDVEERFVGSWRILGDPVASCARRMLKECWPDFDYRVWSRWRLRIPYHQPRQHAFPGSSAL
jgi:hypothetical protein